VVVSTPAQDRAQQERPGDAYEARAGGERPAASAVPVPDQVMAHAADRASDGDIPEHAGKYTFPACSASPSPRPALARVRTRKTSAGSAPSSARSPRRRSRPAAGGTRGGADRVLPGGRRPGPGPPRRAAVRGPLPPAPDAKGRPWTWPSASTRSTATGCTTPPSTPRWAGSGRASATSIARSSFPPTACSRGAVRRGRAPCRRSHRWPRGILICEDAALFTRAAGGRSAAHHHSQREPGPGPVASGDGPARQPGRWTGSCRTWPGSTGSRGARAAGGVQGAGVSGWVSAGLGDLPRGPCSRRRC
jgi:hypothetical protein